MLKSYQRRDLYSHQSTTLCKSTDGEKKLRAKLNADNGWTITSKEFRKRTNIIKTEEKYSHKDQAAATKVEKKQSSQSASTEEAAAVCALVSTIKQVGDSIKALEVATLAAKQTSNKAQLQALRTAGLPRITKKCLAQLNANEGWATNSWAFQMLRDFMAASKTPLNPFHGPLIIALPPSAAAAQCLAKQRDLSVRSWSTHLGTTYSICLIHLLSWPTSIL
ncbi:MAG: hypothetical protein ASARMPREDX12_007926 [Alectoria sarmentosa]|nr:MAG: hypothetical protein ASARMPREDX12_007926 [Alectoria sarmentosa]